MRTWLSDDSYLHTHNHPSEELDVNRHDAHIKSFCMTFDTALRWNVIAAWLDILARDDGESLLRVKGLVNVEGIKEPVVVNAVQHLFHPPARIADWPDGDRQSRIVFITRDLSQADVEKTLRKVEETLNTKIISHEQVQQTDFAEA